jgi:hypothetical protein
VRNFGQVPQTANLQARWEVPVPEQPSDTILILDNATAYSTNPIMVAAPDGAPYVGVGSPDFGTLYRAG